ncbi:VPLPA-CTERM sorting domain-containing protein [uncultured Roseobacter sp.]|uniref:VPLPA-CTERM sorting domain-containing protein n=1 Tax=uncultured Roseobacter sp. TaxID=114847 RepID=UPI002616AC8B|nr:VPLPA-CTERM sorting domain-containing protein [uncultured Roseobacter sp.]
MVYKSVIAAAALLFAAPVASFAGTVNLVDDVYYLTDYNIGAASNPRTFYSNHVTGSGVSIHWSADRQSRFVVEGEKATMTGSAKNTGASGLTFDFELSFTRSGPGPKGAYCQFLGRIDQGCDDDNTKELIAAGDLDPTAWDYFNLDMGTITGTGDLAGYAWALTNNSGHQTQAGASANALLLDGALGLSLWYDYTLISAPDQQASAFAAQSVPAWSVRERGKGDINADLIPTPLPAAAWMLIAGVAGLGAMGRKKRKTA